MIEHEIADRQRGRCNLVRCLRQFDHRGGFGNPLQTALAWRAKIVALNLAAIASAHPRK
jgi:hypothetical protein